MNIILKKLIKFSMRDFTEISRLDNPEFAEGLAELKKKKLPKSSEPSKRIKSKMDVKTHRSDGSIYYTARDKHNRSNKKLLFIHGGGFFLEALPLHWRLCQRLARDTGCEVIFPSSFNTSKVTNMSEMFAESGWTYKFSDSYSRKNRLTCTSEIDLSSFDTSSVTDMSGMFRNSYFPRLDLRGFDTSQVTDMSAMFKGCIYLDYILADTWDTSNVTDMSEMFRDTYNHRGRPRTSM